MTSNVTNMEQSIKKFNTKFRKSTMWNPYGDETARFYKVSEEGYRKVSLGTGCIFIYIIKDNCMEVTEFQPTSGGIFSSFSDRRAEYGFMYMLELSGFLNLDKLTITKRHLKAENFDVFYKYGFSADTDNNYVTRFTIDFTNHNFHKLREEFVKIQTALGDFKKKHNTIKIDWYDCFERNNMLSYQFSYYAHGIKSYFYLNSEAETIYLVDDAVGVRLNLDNNIPIYIQLEEFFHLIKEEGKFTALLQPSDVIYQEVLKNKLSVSADTHNEIFEYLTKSYSQEELDTRLKDEDFSISSKFRHSSDEMNFIRILDVFFVYIKENEELHYYSNSEKQDAKAFFVKLAMKAYNECLLEELENI